MSNGGGDLLMTGMVTPPRDPSNLVYIIFYWLGIGTLLPWNFFISVSEYWKFKWRTANETLEEESDFLVTVDDIGNNDTAQSTNIALNTRQTHWPSHMAVASMVPNVTMLLLNAAFGHRFRTQPRLFVSLCLVIVLFLFTVAMAFTDTESWQDEFYIVTLVSVVLINVNAAIFQGGLLGVAGKFPPRYIGGVFSGQALGGLFASATNVAFLAFGADVVDAASYSFLMAVLFLATALVTFVVVTRTQFYNHYVGESPASKEMSVIVERKVDTEVDQELVKNLVKEVTPEDVGVQLPAKISPLHVLAKISMYAASIFLVFFVTLGCFPAITANVVSTGQGQWSTVYFIPVACFLLFNTGDYLGRCLAEWLKWPRAGSHGAAIITLVLCLARLAFIPLFLFCNVSPANRHLTGVVFASDAAYIIIMLVFSLSNGYLGCVAMMSAPQVCAPEEQQTGASLMVALLGLGLGFGSLASNFIILLL